MRYRTVIEVTSEAENKNEALDIAGEFLRGNLESGIEMKYYSRPIKPNLFLKTAVFFLSVLTFVGVVASLGYFKSAPPVFSNSEKRSAFQPPLKTSQFSRFKNRWEKVENKKALEYIKK